MRQIADWLEKLGLGQHAQRFAENDISFGVLPDLTDQDLKDLGVSLGHRRQLLRAIADLTATEKVTAVAAATAEPHAPQDIAKRRQPTERIAQTKRPKGPDQLNLRIPTLLQVSRPIAMSTAPFSNGGAASVQRREVAMGVYVRSRALVAANEPGTINGSPGRSYGKGRADAKNSRDY